MHQFSTLFLMLLKNFGRNPQALIFSLAFPVIFLIIFGFVYGTEGEPARPILALYLGEMREDGEVLKRVLMEYNDLLIIDYCSSLSQLQEKVGEQKAHFGLFSHQHSFSFYFNPTRIQTNHLYQQLAHSITGRFNQKKTNMMEFVQVKKKAIAVRKGISQLEYMLPGVIALGLFSTGLFSITGSFMHFRERGILKRLAATPIQKAYFLASLMMTRILLAIFSSFIILLVSYVIFGLRPQIQWALFFIFLVISTLAMMGVGFFITIFARSAQNASEIASILLTIMIFFSGIYIPIEFLPPYLQVLGRFLPLYYVAEGLRSIMNVEFLSLKYLFTVMVCMLGGTTILISLATKMIPWEEKI